MDTKFTFYKDSEPVREIVTEDGEIKSDTEKNSAEVLTEKELMTEATSEHNYHNMTNGNGIGYENK